MMTESTLKSIVILGGSYGGVSTAHYLLKHVVPQLSIDGSPYQIILVSASSQTFCRPACPRALISDDMFPQDKLFTDIPKAFEQYASARFRFIKGTATELDHTNRTISIATKERAEKIEFFALVIATGASTPSPLLSVNEDEESLRASWSTFRQGLSTAKSIVICGGGPAGIETAGELGEYLNGRAGWFSSQLQSPKVPITVVTSDSKILPALRPSIAKKAEDYLAKVGVTVYKNTRVATVRPQDAGTDDVIAKATLVLDNGKTLEADLYIPATGMRPNTSFIHEALLTSSRRIDTDPQTLRVDKAGPRIYAIGDVASYARPAIHLVLEAIPVLCANMKRDLLLASGMTGSSTGGDRLFKEDIRETQMVPIGRSKGVGAAMGYQLPSFLVWLIKGRDYWLWTTGALWSGKQWAKES